MKRFQETRCAWATGPRVPGLKTGQSQAIVFKMLIYISKIVPWDAQVNESNFEEINLWRISHTNGNTKISFVDTSVAKELVLVILEL